MKCKNCGSYNITVSLYEICEWWIQTYPDDIFAKEPKEVVQIRELMKEILRQKNSLTTIYSDDVEEVEK